MKKIYLTLSLMSFPLITLAHYSENDMFDHHMNMGNWGVFGGGFFVLLFWVLIIFGGIYLIKRLLGKSEENESGEDKAIVILKERYAKGEITKKEFEEKKKELE